MATKKFLSVEELAARWSVSRQTVYREVRRGRLGKTMIAGLIRFSIAEVERYERVS